MLKSHYTNINESLKDKITQIGANDYEVPDVFADEYLKTKDAKVFGEKVALYIKGWWGGVMEGGLANQNVQSDLIKLVVSDYFDNALPKFIATKTEIYPEKYKILALSLQKN